MRIDLNYNNSSLKVDLPEGATVDICSPVRADQLEEQSLVDILLNAGARAELAQAPLFVVNDGHRGTPTATILSLVGKIAPTALDQSRFVVATGAHEAPSDAHLQKIFGSHLNRLRDRISIHNAHDDSLTVPIGRDHFGQTVRLNRQVAEAEHICVISSVEPHYFAGFTGGRKSFFPGLTDLATIERNHNLAASLEAEPMKLEGNPVAEHMAELLNLIDTDRVFSIQAVTNTAQEIVGLMAGTVRTSFHAAVRLASKLSSCEVERPYDLVIAELRPPLDCNLYQVQKALENCQSAVRERGAVVVVSACSDGVGSPHFYKMADNWDRATNAPLNGSPRFGSHKLARVNQLSKKIMVGLKSELDIEVVKHVFYEPVSDLDQLIRSRSEGKSGFRVAVLKDAGNLVLKIKKKKKTKSLETNL